MERNKASENSCRRKMASIIILTMLIFGVSLLSMQKPEVKADEGGTFIGNHEFTAVYEKAYIWDDHDAGLAGAGEWVFFFWHDTGIYTDEIERDGPGWVDFPDISRSWIVSGASSTSFTLEAAENDNPLIPFSYDYSSEHTLNIQIPGITANFWYHESYKQGDVTHYYSYYLFNYGPIVSEISGPTFVNRADAATFTATGGDVEDSITFEWTIDGAPIARPPIGETSSSCTLSSGTLSPGDHTISVRTKDALGVVSALSSKTFTLLNQPPTVNSLTGPTSGYRGEKLTFTAAATDPDGDALTYEWGIEGVTASFADKTGASFTFSTTDPSTVGKHTLQVRAKDNGGSVSDRKTIDFTILNHPPTVSAITGPTSGYRETYTWTTTGSDVEKDALTYEWYVDGALKSGGSSFTYTFGSGDSTGSYTIKVRVKDAAGDYSDYSTLTFNLNTREEPLWAVGAVIAVVVVAAATAVLLWRRRKTPQQPQTSIVS